MSVNGRSPEGRESFVSLLPSLETGFSVFRSRLAEVLSKPWNKLTEVLKRQLSDSFSPQDRLCDILHGYTPNKRLLFLAGVVLTIACAPTQPAAKATSKALIENPTPISATQTETPVVQIPQTAEPVKPAPTATESPTPATATATATAKPDATSTHESTNTESGTFPKNTVFYGDLLEKATGLRKGGITLFSRNEDDMIITTAVSQDCQDGGAPDRMSVVLVTKPGEINGSDLNRKWSSIGIISGKFTGSSSEVNGSVKINQSRERNCSPMELTFTAGDQGGGTDKFLAAYLRTRNAIGVGVVSTNPKDLIRDINRGCTQCKLEP